MTHFSILSQSFSLSLIFLATPAIASDIASYHSGSVKDLTSQEIVLELEKGTYRFTITEDTKICINGLQANSWEDLQGYQTLMVSTELDNTTVAIRIDNNPMGFDLMSGRFMIPECKKTPKIKFGF